MTHTYNSACMVISKVFPSATVRGGTRCGFYLNGDLVATYNERTGNLCFTPRGKELQKSTGGRTVAWYMNEVWHTK